MYMVTISSMLLVDGQILVYVHMDRCTDDAHGQILANTCTSMDRSYSVCKPGFCDERSGL